MLQRLDRLYVGLNRALVGALMIAMFALVFTNVVTRYGFGFSLSWSEEVARFLMIWATFLGAGLALREGRHVAIELVQDRLSEQARRALRFGLAVLIMVFFVLIVVLGVQFVVFGWDKIMMAAQISRGIPYLAIPIGAAMFALHLLLGFRQFVARDWEEGPVTSDFSPLETPADRSARRDRA
jgi:TRAP-type C4-dicarboxylate transport system permease small subunit